jgi:hypothetical protein
MERKKGGGQMVKNLKLNVISLAVIMGLASIISCESVYAGVRGRNHEVVVMGHSRYHYRDGHFYRPGWFGLEFYIGSAPIGAVVSTIPVGHRTVVVAGTPYYYYDNVYYRRCPTGYVVVQSPTVMLPQGTSRETVIVNVPTASGMPIAITLVRYPNGYVGPQGEFYPELPTADQLRYRYGR